MTGQVPELLQRKADLCLAFFQAGGEAVLEKEGPLAQALLRLEIENNPPTKLTPGPVSEPEFHYLDQK